MALARFVSKNLQQRLLVSSSSSDGLLQRKIWRIAGVRRFSSTGGGGGGGGEEDHSSQGKEITVNEDKKFRLFPKRQGRKWLWRNNDPQFHPILYEIMPSGLGNALMQATENINRLFKSLNISPWSLSSAHVKEQDNLYKLRMEMPGIAKEDVKVIVEDGILSIKGEHKEEKDGSYGSESGDGGEEDGVWSAASYGYYDTRMLLPDDAKVDEMKAELKNGVLIITIPRIEKPQKDVKEVIVN